MNYHLPSDFKRRGIHCWSNVTLYLIYSKVIFIVVEKFEELLWTNDSIIIIVLESMQALTSSKRFSIPSKAKQETDDIESVRLLLNLSCKGIPPVECEQNRGHGAKANNGRRMSFQNWKVFNKEIWLLEYTLFYKNVVYKNINAQNRWNLWVI